MLLRGLKLLLLGTIVLLALAGPKASASKASENFGGQRTAGRAPIVALLAIGVLMAALIGMFAWRPFAQRAEAKAVAQALTKGDAARAPRLMIRYGCGGCHTIDGIPGADGKVGPALRDLVHRVYIGGTASNTADNLVRWIMDPQQFSPHSAMPPPGLADSEARDIAAYLYTH